MEKTLEQLIEEEITTRYTAFRGLGTASALNTGTDMGQIPIVPLPIGSMDNSVNLAFAQLTQAGSAALHLASEFEPAILAGTTLQYWRGDKVWTTLPAFLTTNQSIALSGDATGSGATAISVTLAAVGSAGTFSGVTTDSKGRVTAGTARSISSPSRSLNSAFQPNTTRDTLGTYAVDVSCALSLSGGQSGLVTLQYADDSAQSTNVVSVQSGANGNTGALTIGLNITQLCTVTVSGVIPAGKYAKLVTTNTTGAPTFTFKNAQETVL